MIKQTTVLMATPIALVAAETGTDLHERAGDIIKGLNECTQDIVSFTPENIAQELPDYTRLVPEHTEVLDATTTVVADHIRNALYTISKTIKPVLVETQNRFKDAISPDSAAEEILRYVDMRLVNIEPAFFNSGFYPKAPANTFKEVAAIRLDSLLKGTYPEMSGEELLELIYVDYPDLAPYFANPNEIKKVYDSLFIEKNFYHIFNADAIKDGVANINSAVNYRFDSFNTLVIASLILNKLVMSDAPLDGVTGVSLDDYRASLHQARDMLTTMLYQFKVIWETRAAAGIVILDNGISASPVRDVTTMIPNAITGQVTVGYNNAVLEMFANSDELALSEYVIGYLYAKKRGYQVKDIITDKTIVVDAWKEYLGTVSAAMIVNKGTIANKIFSQVLSTLSMTEEFLPIVEIMEDSVPPNQRIHARISKQMDLTVFFNQPGLLDAVVRGNNSLMNTHLAVVFADALDVPVAKEILEYNNATPSSSVEHQRKLLTEAITRVIVKRLIK